jgi:hypothetical protein
MDIWTRVKLKNRWHFLAIMDAFVESVTVCWVDDVIYGTSRAGVIALNSVHGTIERFTPPNKITSALVLFLVEVARVN